MQRFLCYCFVAVVAGGKIGICSVYVWLQRYRLYLVIWSWLKGTKPNACLCFSFDHNIQVPTLSSCDGQVLTVVVHHSWMNVEETTIPRKKEASTNSMAIHATVGENLSPPNHKQPCDGATLSQDFAKLSRIRPLGTTVNISLQFSTLAIRTQVSYWPTDW